MRILQLCHVIVTLHLWLKFALNITHVHILSSQGYIYIYIYGNCIDCRSGAKLGSSQYLFPFRKEFDVFTCMVWRKVANLTDCFVFFVFAWLECLFVRLKWNEGHFIKETKNKQTKNNLNVKFNLELLNKNVCTYKLM